MTYGNGVTLAQGYDLDGRLAAIDAFNGVTPVLDLDYGFDLAGNVTDITDAGGGPRGRNFGYDELRRLVATEEVIGGIVTRSTGFAYDHRIGFGRRPKRSIRSCCSRGPRTPAHASARPATGRAATAPSAASSRRR